MFLLVYDMMNRKGRAYRAELGDPELNVEDIISIRIDRIMQDAAGLIVVPRQYPDEYGAGNRVVVVYKCG